LIRFSRRVFVRSLVPAGAVAGAAQWLGCDTSDAGRTDAAAAGEVDSGSDAGSGVCPEFLTPTAEFFAQFGGSRTVDGWSLPDLDPGHTLRIEGLVGAPSSIDLAALEADAAAHVTVVKTMMCVLGFRSAAVFTGIPLRELLDRAAIDRSQARRVRFFGADGFENNLRLDDIYAPPSDAFEPLIAFRIHGQRLPRELGFPFRLLLADRYGYKNTKWLARIEVSAEDIETGQYQTLGYADAGVIEPVPIVEGLRVSEAVPTGPLELCGFALSGRGGVERVELSLDGETPVIAALDGLDAQLARHPELRTALQLVQAKRFGPRPRGVWTAWRATLELSAGRHTVALRVLDAGGNVGEATTLTLEAAG
jgi:DMSO/TMAO reductase YedYZ molybdopterin-dependent catalytic subunit